MTKIPSGGRIAIVAASLTGATLMALPAGGAWAARGDGWQPLFFAPYDAACGATTVHSSTSVNQEYYRETRLPDGTIRWQVTGALKINYTTDEHSVNVNASGPGNLLNHVNGDVQILADGLNSYTFTPEQAATLGVPQISVSAGPIDLTFHPDGSVSGHMGNIIEDVCAELT
jgi:hypothetical protein